MNISTDIQELTAHLQDIGKVRLFLDYDGTLAEFAPTPDDILPEEELIQLLTRLGKHPKILLSVVSGRRLGHVQELLPVPGILLAGTYGVEMRLPEGGQEDQVDYDEIRPVIEEVKPRWEALLEGREGFFLEDKGWALGIHGRRADEQEADEVLDNAEQILAELTLPDEFRVLGGFKFIEIGPKLAHKGQTIHYLLQRFPWPDAALVFVGDDDKDEEAFEVIKQHGGTPILVSREPRRTYADYRLESPRQTRRWLQELLNVL